MTAEKNRRIVKNTSILYFRMLFTLGVSLYISRVVLNTLGIEDYGIYSVVGGFVIIFSFLNNSMATATQRFLSFEIGKKNFPQLAKVFSMSVNIHWVIGAVIFILAETIGLWFVNTKLNLPEERMAAAIWVYHLSVFSFVVTIVSVPYNALIIAHERMNVFAWISIVEVCLKLLAVFVLQWYAFDKLEFYAVLMFAVALIVLFSYWFYCKRSFAEARFRIFWDYSLFKSMMSFSVWSLWGNVAFVMYGQGVNILLNIFFGPVINAARGIAYQVHGAVSGFVQNLQMAMNPQIIKSFAEGDLKYMHQLIFQSSKFSFFLLFIVSLPILLEAEAILKLWLGVVPEYTVIFTQLVIVNVLIDSISGSLMTAAQASGKIKLYQMVVGGLLLLILPISYIFLTYGFPPDVTLLVSIIVSVLAFIARLVIIRILVGLSISEYLRKVILPIIPVVLLSIILPITFKFLFLEGHLRSIIVCISSVVSIVVVIYFIGLNRDERLFILNKLNQFYINVRKY